MPSEIVSARPKTRSSRSVAFCLTFMHDLSSSVGSFGVHELTILPVARRYGGWLARTKFWPYSTTNWNSKNNTVTYTVPRSRQCCCGARAPRRVATAGKNGRSSASRIVCVGAELEPCRSDFSFPAASDRVGGQARSVVLCKIVISFWSSMMTRQCWRDLSDCCGRTHTCPSCFHLQRLLETTPISKRRSVSFSTST